ncbi:Hypothetical protein D9617_10g072930 [Elsinoe fawcettii]|nr:Hypothetical protein D9617_10g072930 [Elsinoe fawcettii]
MAVITVGSGLREVETITHRREHDLELPLPHIYNDRRGREARLVVSLKIYFIYSRLIPLSTLHIQSLRPGKEELNDLAHYHQVVPLWHITRITDPITLSLAVTLSATLMFPSLTQTYQDPSTTVDALGDILSLNLRFNIIESHLDNHLSTSPAHSTPTSSSKPSSQIVPHLFLDLSAPQLLPLRSSLPRRYAILQRLKDLALTSPSPTERASCLSIIEDSFISLTLLIRYQDLKERLFPEAAWLQEMHMAWVVFTWPTILDQNFIDMLI